MGNHAAVSRIGLDAKRSRQVRRIWQMRVPTRILTLAELEATTCLWLTRLLTLNGAAVACEEACILESLLVFGVDFHESTCDSEAKGLALACKTATVEVGLDVVFTINIEQLQWLLYHVAKNS